MFPCMIYDDFMALHESFFLNSSHEGLNHAMVLIDYKVDALFFSLEDNFGNFACRIGFMN